MMQQESFPARRSADGLRMLRRGDSASPLWRYLRADIHGNRAYFVFAAKVEYFTKRLNPLTFVMPF
jgi:hypothetical protein